MKKLLLFVAVAIFSLSTFAETGEKSVIINGLYKTEMKQFGVGAGARYGLTDNIRLAPSIAVMFPKDKTVGLDINVNAEYAFDLQNDLSIYPLAGVNMYNWHYSGETINGVKTSSVSGTDFGFNIGCGLDYNLSKTNFLNAQFTYTFNDGDYATFSIGYGIKF